MGFVCCIFAEFTGGFVNPNVVGSLYILLFLSLVASLTTRLAFSGTASRFVFTGNPRHLCCVLIAPFAVFENLFIWRSWLLTAVQDRVWWTLLWAATFVSSACLCALLFLLIVSVAADLTVPVQDIVRNTVGFQR